MNGAQLIQLKNGYILPAQKTLVYKITLREEIQRPSNIYRKLGSTNGDSIFGFAPISGYIYRSTNNLLIGIFEFKDNIVFIEYNDDIDLAIYYKYSVIKSTDCNDIMNLPLIFKYG